jgi:indolepyruvate ferredoxin oxidoreductase alpha subunit
MPALANAIYNQTPFTTIVVDNRTTGMTGHQGNPASGLTLHRDLHTEVDIAQVARGMGIEEVATVESRDLDEFEAVVKKAIKSNKPAVVIAKTPCVFVTSHPREAYKIVEEDCNGCTMCFRIGCPAISKSEVMDEQHNRPKASIDAVACVGCGLCYDVCARQAILEGALKQEAVLTTHVA